MKKVAGQHVRLMAAAEMRRQLGDQPARIVVDGVEMDDATVRQEVKREDAAAAQVEQQRYKKTLELISARNSTGMDHVVGEAREKLGEEVRTLERKFEHGNEAMGASLDKLKWHGHEIGAWTHKVLDSDTSAVNHRASVEVTLPGQQSKTFAVDVHEKGIESVLRSSVLTASLGGFQPVPLWGAIIDSALAAVTAASAIVPAVTGQKELRDALLRTAGKVFTLGAVGEVDVAGITAFIAIANELRQWATQPVQVVDQAALDAFLNKATPAAPPQPSLGWETVAPPPAPPSIDRPPAGAPAELGARVVEKAIADRQATENSIAANAGHHVATQTGREALTWALRAMSTNPQVRSRVNLQQAALDERLTGAETSKLSHLPVVGSLVSHAKGHLSDAEVATMLGGQSVDEVAQKSREKVASNLAALGLTGDLQQAYDAFLAGADLR